jgi:hypothetical protein
MNEVEAREEIQALRKSLEFEAVHAISFSGERTDPSEANSITLEIESAVATLPTKLSYKFNVTGRILTSGDDEVATLRVALVAQYKRREQQNALSSEVLNAFGEQVGLRDVWPYLREYVHSMMQRLGFLGVHLGFLDVERETISTTAYVHHNRSSS